MTNYNDLWSGPCIALVSLLVTSCVFADDVEVLDLGAGVNQPPGAVFSNAVPIVHNGGTGHGEQIFFALFEPGPYRHWLGNIKRYRLAAGDEANGGLLILDANGGTAVDADTGLPAADSRDLWTPAHLPADGAEISHGGLASRIYAFENGVPNADSRRVYTFTGANPDLTDSGNALHENNVADGIDPYKTLTKTLFGAQSLTDADFVELIQWVRGVDVDDSDADGDRDEGRMELGAPLHSRPVIVDYGDTADGMARNVIFTITNSGFLHAARIDGDDPGTQLEQFAFVPRELLPKMLSLRMNPAVGDENGLNKTPIYGLDGGLTVWRHDGDRDNAIANGGDHVYVYFGQRRGGLHYYAIDVTDIDSPRFLWSIDGGKGAFAELGQTWSAPVHTRMVLQLESDAVPTARDVLVFGGGYDPKHDSAGLARSGDSRGRALFIVDAVSGALLWWAGPSGHSADPDLGLSTMRYAIPATVAVIDNDGDGLSELLLVGDLGGQVWRFDVVDGRLHGGVIADLQAEGPSVPGPEQNRRFFEPPDVAIAHSPVLGEYLAIAIGSGYRAHPLDRNTADAFFLLRDPTPSGPPRNANGDIEYRKINAGDLLDVSDRPALDRAELTEAEAGRYNNGWRLSLQDTTNHAYSGEKVLAPALIADHSVMFTTYTPAADATPAAPGNGRSRLYVIELEDGTPRSSGSVIGQQKVDADDRFEDLPGTGLPAGPVVIFPPFDGDGVDPVVLVGTRPTGVTLKHTLLGTYWFQDHVH